MVDQKASKGPLLLGRRGSDVDEVARDAVDAKALGPDLRAATLADVIKQAQGAKQRLILRVDVDGAAAVFGLLWGEVG